VASAARVAEDLNDEELAYIAALPHAHVIALRACPRSACCMAACARSTMASASGCPTTICARGSAPQRADCGGRAHAPALQPRA
jgi:hypothetical protein